MKDLLKEGLKKGIIIWIAAHLLLYVLCAYQNDFTLYDAQIDKLHSIKNFVTQLVYVMFLYTSLSAVFEVYVDNMFKYSAKGEHKEAVKNAVIALIITLVICVTMVAIKQKDIVHKTIIKLMVLLMFFKAVVLVIKQVIDNSVYNKKLQEKNKE